MSNPTSLKATTLIPMQSQYYAWDLDQAVALIFEAINWNKQTDSYSMTFWEQNVKQMWVDTEYVPAKDELAWERLSPEHKELYKHVLGGLTLLDTLQSEVGMNTLAKYSKVDIHRAIMTFMGMMEAVHAKSYSTIFTTLIDSNFEIDSVFEWVAGDEYLQFKSQFIDVYYRNIKAGDDESLYLGYVASVFLESFLFYSGFFFPLWLSGHGTMIASGEIIKKIVQDEAIHGMFIGRVAQDLYKTFDSATQKKLDLEIAYMMHTLMDNEVKYTESIYAESGMESEVKDYLIYNANKAMRNLGKKPFYDERKINPIVEIGLSTESDTHDFFSTKGSGYVKAIHEPLTDEDMVFDLPELI